MPAINPTRVGQLYGLLALSASEARAAGIIIPYTIAHGVVNAVGMSVTRVTSFMDEIVNLISSIDGAIPNGQVTLPFANCKNQSSNHAQWTASDTVAEQLLAIGEAAGKVAIQTRGRGFTNARIRINMNGTPPPQNSLLSNGNRGTARIS